ncbi:hypothetical protein FB451DRAFT_1178292 [Mycena latifolia]|nr:hypothetical protein FB451DRAFT_1178292 [Mycena latifolia]
MPGESLVKAAERIAGGNAPHVMFGIVDRSFDRKKAVQNFYQAENRRARIVEIRSEEDSSEGNQDLENEWSSLEDSESGEVYLTRPQRMSSTGEPLVQHADRTVPSTRTARKQSFDGVYPPRRENVKVRAVRDLQEGKSELGNETRGIGGGVGADQIQISSQNTGNSTVKKDKPDLSKGMPEIIPVEARQVRFEKDDDVEMTDARNKEKAGKKKNLERKMDADEGKTLKKEDRMAKSVGRQSEISATVNKSEVMDRILDTEVKLTLRELVGKHALDDSKNSSEFRVGEQLKDQNGSLKESCKIKEIPEKRISVSAKLGRLEIPKLAAWVWVAATGLYVIQILMVFWIGLKEMLWKKERFWKRRSQDLAGFKEEEMLAPFSCRPTTLPISTMETNVAERELHNFFPLPPGHQDEAAALRQMLPVDIVAPVSVEVDTPKSNDTDYLSRREYHRPYSPTNPIHTADPAHAVDNAVIAEWDKYERNEELEPYPTFAAAPHSVYYGRSILPDGQVAHYHVSLNVLRLLKNRDTKLPFSVAGHEYTVTLQAPPPGVTWAREAWYPTDDALHKEMVRMAPLDPPDEGEIGFPVHATSKAPPLPTRSERERARSVRSFLSQTNIDANFGMHLQLSRGPIVINHYQFEGVEPKEHSDSDSSVYLPAENSDDASDESPGTASSLPTTDTTTSDPASVETVTAVDELAQDIEKRAKAVLLFDEDSDDDEMPPLVPAEWQPQTGSCFETILESALSASVHITASEFALSWYQDRGTPLATQEEPTVPRALIAASPIISQSGPLQQFTTAARIAELVQLGGEIRQSLDALQGRLMRRAFATKPEGATALVHEITLALLGETKTETSDDTATSIPAPIKSAHTSYADRASAPPRFRHRRVVSRDVWSSSSISSNNNSDDDDYEEIEPYAPSQRPVARFTNRSSPAVTEWSVTSSDFAVNPQEVIDAALVRITTSRQTTPPSSTFRTGESSSDSSSRTSEFLRSVSENTGHKPHFQYRDSTTDEQRVALDDWLFRCHAHQDEHTTTEDDVCGAPFRHVLYVLHEHLHNYLDPAAMAADGWDRLDVLSTLSMGFNTHTFLGTTSEDSAMPLAPLDIPIPTPPTSPTLGPLVMTADGQLRQGLADSISSSVDPNETVQTGKRKSPSDEHVGEFQEGPRKKFPSGLMDPDNIRLLAGVRMAVLEGSQRLEGLVWHKYEVDEQHYPTEYLRHPLLFDVETAKLQVMYNVLYRNHRYELAALLHEVLTLRFKNEYAISHLLNARFLEQQHPSSETRYWELLPPPPSAINDDRDEEDPSSDSDDNNYFYPDYEFRYTGDDATIISETAISAAPSDVIAQLEGDGGTSGNVEGTPDLEFVRREEDWAHISPADWSLTAPQ